MSVTTKTTTRGGTAVRGAVAAGTATALLLGGFGAFALWSDAQEAGATGQIATGYLALDEITGPVTWQLENPQDGGPATPIDPATFLASPGDVLSYSVPITGTVTGSDITAELTIDLDQIDIDPALASGDVEVGVVGADGTPLLVVGTEAGTDIDETVSVRVEFSEDMTGGMSLPAAVDVDGMDLILQQVID